MVSEGELILMKRRRKLERLTIPSQFFHLLNFTLCHSQPHLKCGAIITSIDIDVGSHIVGEINQGKNDLNVHGYLSDAAHISERRVGEIEEMVVPRLIELYNELDMPVTFAVRGQVVETQAKILDLLLDSPVKHDIGAHGYYHRMFTDLSMTEAQEEMELISDGMGKLGIKPSSFVFPKNKVNHLCLLEKFGYKCYRDEGLLRNDGMFIRKVGRLYDVHPSFFLGCTYNPIFLNKIIDIAAKRKLPFHVWFHPLDLYETKGSTKIIINQVLSPIYEYAKKKEKDGELNIETMCSIVEKL